MMRDRLARRAAPVLAQIKEHPFWEGLRRGTLAPEVLRRFAEQDAHHVVPSYARALARCAALADDDAHGELLAQASAATFGSLPRLHTQLAALPPSRDDEPPAGGDEPPDRTDSGRRLGGAGGGVGGWAAYCSLMLAAPESGFAAGVGALLPMTWFHLEVGEDLRARYARDARYAGWIEAYLPDPGFFPGYVDAFIAMVDEVGETASDGARELLEQFFGRAARLEWEFVDFVWRANASPK
ncbi:hypothetical protein AB0J52_17485 [Spirillospora sp. NPDC049652]